MKARIRTRENSDGSKTYQVLYRRGGRYFAVEYAGSFRGWPGGKRNGARMSLTDAQEKAQSLHGAVSGWLAAGLDPRDELTRMKQPKSARKLTEVARAWLASRLDLSEQSARVYRAYIDAIAVAPIGELDPASVTPADVQALIATWAKRGDGAKTIRERVNVLRQVLDDEVELNPARHRSVRLPAIDQPEVEPPSASEYLTILERVAEKYRLPLVVIEQTGMRVGETVALEWRDVDEAGHRFRVRAEATKGRRGSRRARSVQVPAWLMEIVAATCPREDRVPERRVFQGITADGIRSAMGDACKLAGIVHYSPHDLRHRRSSLWHGQGVPAAELAKRVGHSKPSMTLDVYSHVMPLDEVPESALRRVLVRTR